MTIQSSDLVMGKNVKWYSGGVATLETVTIEAADVSAGYFQISGTAEWGLVRATVDGVETALLHYQPASTTAATQATGSKAFSYTGMTAGDVVVLRYINIASTVMTQIAASKGGNIDYTGDVISAAIDGQSTKVYAVGAAEGTVTWGELDYNEDFIAAMMGSKLTGDVASGKSTWSNAVAGFNSVGALVGIEYASNGTTVLKKYGLIGVTPTTVGMTFATESYYERNYSARCDAIIVFDNS